jgi:hypothetical protein
MPSRRRAVSSFGPLLTAAVAVVFLGGGCAAVTRAPSDTSLTTGADLTLTVVFDRTTVEPGGSLNIDVAIHNSRLVPVVLALDQCGAPASMHATVPVPIEPAGRAWGGIAGDLKTYALTQGFGQGGVPAMAPVLVFATWQPCRGRGDEITLAPGDSTSGSLVWAAELVNDVPAPAGDVAFRISVAHDPSGGPPTDPPGYTGPAISWIKTYEQLARDGTIQIVGAAPRLLTAGQALDAILADPRFAAWLAEEPENTWSVANLFLVNNATAGGVVPAGPAWEIDLFREIGVPRNWAIGFVDPHTGEILNLTLCDIPCDR